MNRNSETLTTLAFMFLIIGMIFIAKDAWETNNCKTLLSTQDSQLDRSDIYCLINSEIYDPFIYFVSLMWIGLLVSNFLINRAVAQQESFDQRIKHLERKDYERLMKKYNLPRIVRTFDDLQDVTYKRKDGAKIITDHFMSMERIRRNLHEILKEEDRKYEETLRKVKEYMKAEKTRHSSG